MFTFPITASTKISIQPEQVEYRQLTGHGVRVVRVQLVGSEPRILMWSERATGTGTEVLPMSLSLSEIEQLVVDARERTGR